MKSILITLIILMVPLVVFCDECVYKYSSSNYEVAVKVSHISAITLTKDNYVNLQVINKGYYINCDNKKQAKDTFEYIYKLMGKCKF